MSRLSDPVNRALEVVLPRHEALCAAHAHRERNMPVMEAAVRGSAWSDLCRGLLEQAVRQSLQKVEELAILFGDLKEGVT